LISYGFEFSMTNRFRQQFIPVSAQLNRRNNTPVLRYCQELFKLTPVRIKEVFTAATPFEKGR
jgi:hypothetical protein